MACLGTFWVGPGLGTWGGGGGFQKMKQTWQDSQISLRVKQKGVLGPEGGGVESEYIPIFATRHEGHVFLLAGEDLEVQ